MTKEAQTGTNPAPGVIATRPTTSPVEAPTSVGRPFLISIDQHPGKQCGRSGDSRGHKCMGGEAVGNQGASGVKTEPSEPEHGGTENDKRYIVDPVGHVFISAAFSKKERKDKSADAGADVYDVSAGKIHRTDCGEKTALSPYHMRQRVIDDQRPQGCEQKQCFEFHTAHQEPVIRAGVIMANII